MLKYSFIVYISNLPRTWSYGTVLGYALIQ